MKACVLRAVNDLQYGEVPDPIRKPGEVLVRIKASGICGSDLPRVFEKGTYHFPTIPGHEFSGEIVEADDKALIGGRCAVYPILPCRKCASCETGHYAQCENYGYFGSRRDGGFAEYLSAPLWNIVFAPDDLTYEEIAMAEPCAVALHALERADFRMGFSVCVFGAGPIGIMIGKWARLKGASDVTLIDVDEKKIAFAGQLGFQTAMAPGEKADVVIEGAGVSASFENAMKAAKPFGTVVLMGNPAREMTLSQSVYSEILRKELTIKGTWNSSYNAGVNDWKTVLAFMKKLDIACLVSHRFQLSECNTAFNLMRERKEFFNKVMFVNE